MGKIDSPVKKYSGYVILPDFYGYGELIAWTEAIDKADTLIEGEDTSAVPLAKMLPYLDARALAILPMVSEWHIDGLGDKPEKLPATPIIAAKRFNFWLSGEIWNVINGDELAVDPTSGGVSTPG